MERLTIQEIIEHCERKIEGYEKKVNMEFLYQESLTNLSKEYWEHKQVSEYLKELMKYRELEEQGRLLKLQCNVGTEVFVIFPIGDHYEKCQIKKIEIRSTVLEKIRYFVEPTAHRGCSFSYFDNEFEKYVFLTKEEAEAKLKEMKNKTNVMGIRKQDQRKQVNNK